MKLKNITTMVAAFLLGVSGYSQEADGIRCGVTPALHSKPVFQKERLLKKAAYAKYQKQKAQQKPGSVGSYVIPVVVHVFGTNFNAGTTVTKEVVELAIKQTNEDFQGLAADYNTIDAPFDAIKETMDITFKLAQIDPSGNPTIGINFYPEKSGFGNGSGYDAQIASYAWDNEKYMNVYIMNDLYADGDKYNSGVAWYPSQSMTDANTARVVHNGSYLSTINTSENFRSVFTHEFGHWLDLPHTFAGGVCTNDTALGDGVADTPSHKNNSSGTACAKIYNCLNQEINNENFMDYTDCYKMFTRGQVARMEAALNDQSSTARYPLWQEANLRATGVFEALPPRVVPSNSAFNEVELNNGAITNTIDLECVDCTFTKSSGTLTPTTEYTIANLPAGLTPEISLTSNTKATLTLTGAATTHELAQSISNLELTFTDAAVTQDISTFFSDKVLFSVLFKDAYTSFCTPGVRYATYAHIVDVSFDGSSNPTNYTGYTDYAGSVRANVFKGQTYTLKIKTNKGSGGATDKLRIQGWFDWNADFYLDSSELVVSKEYTNAEVDASGNYEYTQQITIPAGANLGDLNYRITAHYVQGTEGDNPCDTVDSGETEDYGLRVLDPTTTLNADFSASKTAVTMADVVSFYDASVYGASDPVTGWSWTFQGATPSSSTDKNPSGIVFSQEGTYDVSLTVTTASGATKTITKSAYITAALAYCATAPKYGGYFNVTNVKFNTIDHNPLTSRSNDYYSTVSTDVVPGAVHEASFTVNKGAGGASDINRVRVWIDWNYNSAFEASELVVSRQVTGTDYDASGNFTFTQNISVPLDAKTGKKVGMRVLGHYVQGTEGDTACGDYDSGNNTDYGVNILNGTSGVLADFSLSSTAFPISQELVLQDTSSVSGGTITSYQWSFEGAQITSSTTQTPPALSFNNPGVYTISLTVTDSNGNTNTKTEQVTVNYVLCEVAASWGTQYAHITNVSFGTVNNTTSQDGTVVNDYYSTNSAEVMAGQDIPFSVTVNKGNSGDADTIALKVWIDFNYNGVLEASELVRDTTFAAASDFDASKNKVDSFTVTVPTDAVKETLYVRVKAYYAEPNKEACTAVDSGEVEDYGLKVTQTLSVATTNALDATVFYPIPATTSFTIALPFAATNQHTSVVLYTLNGKVVSAPYKIVGSNAIDVSVSNLDRGSYIVVLKHKDNKVSKQILVK